MALNIRHPEIDRLARELAQRRGESITEAVLAAWREEMRPRAAGTADDLMAIGRRFSSLPILDERSDDEILGYDEDGLPS
jgi:antitoxin VapB